MNGCNARGFLEVGGGNICILKNIQGGFTKMEGGYGFFFNESFDALQNAVIRGKNGLNVYLKNDLTNTFIYIGTTDYIIFPNTSLPLSFPFYSFRKPQSYLFIPYEGDDVKFSIYYEALMIKREMKEEISSKSSYPYNSVYHLRLGELYNFERDLVHKPIETSIDY